MSVKALTGSGSVTYELRVMSPFLCASVINPCFSRWTLGLDSRGIATMPLAVRNVQCVPVLKRQCSESAARRRSPRWAIASSAFLKCRLRADEVTLALDVNRVGGRGRNGRGLGGVGVGVGVGSGGEGGSGAGEGVGASCSGVPRWSGHVGRTREGDVLSIPRTRSVIVRFGRQSSQTSCVSIAAW